MPKSWCGSRFHPEFVNVDFVSSSRYVRGYDLNKDVPFGDEVFDVVYHSHFVEHLQKQKALEFLNECHRVLKAGGIIRVAVPDLEQIARAYLEALNGDLQRQEKCEANYDWMMLELNDQTVRGKKFSIWIMVGMICRTCMRCDARIELFGPRIGL
jgi:predicted SAM-dependent methyltransferase